MDRGVLSLILDSHQTRHTFPRLTFPTEKAAADVAIEARMATFMVDKYLLEYDEIREDLY